MEGSSVHYLVHYAGWNNRYDEWVQKERIMGVVDTPSDRSAKSKINLISPKSRVRYSSLIYPNLPNNSKCTGQEGCLQYFMCNSNVLVSVYS